MISYYLPPSINICGTRETTTFVTGLGWGWGDFGKPHGKGTSVVGTGGTKKGKGSGGIGRLPAFLPTAAADVTTSNGFHETAV